MKYIKYFDTLIEANTAGAEGFFSPHVDVVGEKATVNYINVGIDGEFNCEYSTDGSAINIKPVQPKNEIWYSSTDGQIVEAQQYYEDAFVPIPIGEGYDVFGANIVSNTYVDGKGIIKFDGDVIGIGMGAFYECSLTSINIPDSVTSIGRGAFVRCYSLESINIPDSVTSIGDTVFNECTSLTSITIPDSVTEIENLVFNECKSLISVTIGNSVTSIGDFAFEGCESLTSINIPDSVTSIGEAAFLDCKSITSITIGNSVTSIGYNAFYGCTSLTSLTSLNPIPPTANSYFLSRCSALTDIFVPAGSVDAYKTATNWSAYASKIKAIED